MSTCRKPCSRALRHSGPPVPQLRRLQPFAGEAGEAPEADAVWRRHFGMTCSSTGQPQKKRSVITLIDADRTWIEMFPIAADGNPMMTMEINCTRIWMSEFQQVCAAEDVPPGGMLLVELEDRLAIVFHIDGRFYCLDDVCTHDGGPLSDGDLEGCQIACPRHGARFDVRTGKALTMPATQDTGCHEVKVDDGQVWVRIAEPE